MKSREEEIETAIAKEDLAEYSGGIGYSEPDAFRLGAEWADANPSPEVLALVGVLNVIATNTEDITTRPQTNIEYHIGVLAADALVNFNKSRGSK